MNRYQVERHTSGAWWVVETLPEGSSLQAAEARFQQLCAEHSAWSLRLVWVVANYVGNE